MLHNYEYRFELKPGKFVYIPTKEGRLEGKKIVTRLLKSWAPADYFYHFGKRGGHVAALRPHVSPRYKASVDLRSFFTSISRTKVQRSLRSIGYANRYALDIATQSCVEADGRKFLPYGFVQSMALATLSVEKSQLGREIDRLRQIGIAITFYVDDILLSSDNFELLAAAFQSVCNAVSTSNLEVAMNKLSPPSEEVESFNCRIKHGQIEILDERMERFKEQLKTANSFGRDAILRYIGVLNKNQHDDLAKLNLF